MKSVKTVGAQKGKETGISITPGFLRRAIDLIENCIIITDTSGTMLFLNRKARQLFGYGVRASIGKSIGMLFLPDDLAYFLPNILKTTRIEGEYRGENLLQKKNGTRIFVKLETVLYRGEGRGGDRIIITLQEIEKLKDLERDYLESQRLASLGKMTEGIAHKIRNPIVSIGGFARRISRKISHGDQGHYFMRIEREIGRLEAIVDQVQEFAILPKPIHRRQNIRKIVEASLKSISAKGPQKELAIDFEVEGPNWNPMPYIDGDLLARALGYILDNAFEAIEEGGAIHVKLFPKDDFIGIEISDTGCGIPEGSLGAIFDPFFSTKPDRVGIKLATAHRIIKEQGGTIQVSSQQGKGTSFSILLPKDRRRRIRTHIL
jgi:PAS domain S-box-containing protein